ncbi:MAG: peptidase S41 [Bacteroidetes bacterium HGW-Bacteroidetes-17]|jgi:Tol biopolymer transport system component|nr:MAG: peptidase S41 [Bacteroidetes bacterium HGW-Bacteroidetes-17]
MNKLLKSILFSFLLIITLTLTAQENPLWLRYPAISPNGQSILFNYQGDIYKVAASGGIAVPLNMSDSYEYGAVWSHDGKNIAFASDRYGNFDVFMMPANGGEAIRKTFHSNAEIPSAFTPDDKQIVFSAARQDLYTNVQFPMGTLTELYSVPVEGGRVSQIITSPAIDATFSPDGKKLIFHDQKGYENIWRKHHTSAITRDIWVYDMASKNFKMLTNFKGEDRNPVFDSNNNDFYYLSEESGSFNIQKSSLSDPSKNTAITHFTKNPIRFLTSSKDNTLCFSYQGEIYTMDSGNEPKKINIQIAYDGRGTLDKIVPVSAGFTDASLSPNGQEFAYVFRGEIFVSSIEHGTTKRITNTPWQERSVSFSPDGRSLVYAAEVDNSWNVYSKSIMRAEEPYFYTSTLLKEETIIATPAEEFQPTYSPDGKEVAYLENRTTLKVVNLASKQSRTILPAKYNYSYSDGDQWYQWSPDSKWFLVEFGQPERVMDGEVGLISASGKGELMNLSQSGYSDGGPKWAMDGKMMIWFSSREGTKSENDRIAFRDIFGMFFTQECYDRFKLSEEDFALLEEKEKKDKKEEKKPEADKKDKKPIATEKDSKEVKDLIFDWENLRDRKQKLTVNTSSIGDGVLSKEGDKLYYLTRFEGRNDLWMTDLRKNETKLFTKIGANSVSMEISADGKFLFILADGKAMKVTTSDGKSKSIRTNGEMLLKQADERAYIYDHSWRQVREKFYVEDLQGVNWDYYYTEYKKFLPYINNSYDFAEMLSEMLGELNASHTGASYRSRIENGDQTSSLGLLYDDAYLGNGLKVAEVIKGGPLNNAKSKIRSNDIIEKIDGEAITPSIDFYQLLNRKTGKYVLLSMYNPTNNTRWEEVVKPISLGEEGQLLYTRWVETRRAEVERLSGGKLGYVHVRGMNDPSMRTVFEDALGKHLSADALIVDTRFNGGGNLHDQLSDFLTGKKYMDIIPHGQNVGYQPGNRWIKPSIVVMGESNYSDAHLFPVAYKIKGGGKLLGMPVPGTGTFVWWENQIDPTITFGIPMGGWRPIGEPFLENHQTEPDIMVRNEPAMMAIGRDQQIEAAVKELLKK